MAGSPMAARGHGGLLARLALAGVLAAGWTALAAVTPAQAHPVVLEDPSPQATDQATDHPTTSGHATPSAHASDQATDHASAQASDQATDHASDQATDQATDHASDQATDQATDHASDQATDGATEGATDQPTDQATDSPVDTGSGAAKLTIHFAVGVGAPSAGAPVDVSAQSLQPDSELSVWVFSTPRLLATSTADSTGHASISTHLPADLAPGVHTVLVKATGADGQPQEAASSVNIGPDGTIEAIGADASTTGLEVPALSTDAHVPAYAPVTPLDSPAFVAATSVAALTLATVVGAGIGVSALRSSPTGSGGGGGGLDASVRNRSDDVDDTDDFGGRARPAARVGLVLASGATSVRRISPLFSRIMLDAAPIRALVGSVSILLPIAAIVLGVIGGVGVDGKAQPATLGIMIALIAIGVFDSLAGLLGALAFSVVVVLTGGVVDVSSVRTLIGVLLIIIGPGLIGSSFRDIRRRKAMGSAAVWERLTDIVVVPLLGAWTAIAIVKALPDLGGRAFPIAEHATQIGVVVLVCLVLKVLVEEAAARWSPARMRAVTLLSDIEPGNAQRIVSALLRTGMFLLVAAAFVSNVWQLWIAALLFLIPGLLALLAHRFRNVAALWQVIPEGVVLFVLMIVIGLIVTAVLTAALGSTPTFAQDTFLIMAVPGFLLAVLGLVAQGPRDGDVRWYMRPSMTVLYRVGGIVMLVVAVVLATRS